jgi:hypothetical protein
MCFLRRAIVAYPQFVAPIIVLHRGPEQGENRDGKEVVKALDG